MAQAVATAPGAAHPTTPQGRIRKAVSGRTDWMICAAIMGLALLFRAVLLGTVYANIDSDQAVVGLMAYHIQAGQHPLLYYGQPYQGSLEAYAAALLFTLFGANDWTLRLPALACSVLFVGALYALSMTLYGRRIAVLSGLFVALGPALLIFHSTAAGFGYVEVMLCGTILLTLAARYPDLHAMPRTVALAMGLLAGLGFWIEPLMVEYLLAIAAAYALVWLPARRQRSVLGWRHPARSLIAMAGGAVIGCAPLLAYNLRNDGATLYYLFHNGQSGDHLAVAGRLITQSLPIVLGLAIGDSSSRVFDHLAASHAVQYGVGVAAGIVIAAWLLLAPNGLPRRIACLVRKQGPTHTFGDGLLALFALCCVLFFVFSRFGARQESTSIARYLLPIYSVTPLLLDCFIPRRRGQRATAIAALAIGSLLLADLSLTLAPHPQGLMYRPAGTIERVLERQGIRVVYVNYWLTYKITFETHERVLSVPANGVRLARVRLPEYMAVAAQTPSSHLAWIFAAGSSAERDFLLLMKRTHTRARRTMVEDQVIYDRATRPLRITGPYQT